MDEFKQKLEETLNRLYKQNQLSIDAYAELMEFADPHQNLQLQQTGVSNRYLVEYLNKGGACRQTYVEAVNEEVAKKAFFIYNDGTITSITDIRHL